MPRKRAFLLLEVMIALALVALCIIPLMAPYLWMVQEERALAREMQQGREEALIFSSVIEGLYRNQFSWSQILSNETIPLTAPTAFRSKQRDGTKKEKYKLLDIAILPTPDTPARYTYSAFVENTTLKTEE